MVKKILPIEAIKKLQERTTARGGEIVGLLKNRSASFAPSFSCSRLIEAIVFNTNEIVPIAAFLSGEYGLDDVCLGVPCIVNRSGIAKIIELDLSTVEREKVTQAAQCARRDINGL